MTDNERDDKDEDGELDRIPIECGTCGRVFLWCISDPGSMECPDCGDTVPDDH